MYVDYRVKMNNYRLPKSSLIDLFWESLNFVRMKNRFVCESIDCLGHNYDEWDHW